MKTVEVVLGGMGFIATVADRQVIFESSRNVWSTHTKFALERPMVTSDGHSTPGTWQFVYLDATSHQVALSRLVQAYEWCIQEFGADFEPYKGDLSH